MKLSCAHKRHLSITLTTTCPRTSLALFHDPAGLHRRPHDLGTARAARRVLLQGVRLGRRGRHGADRRARHPVTPGSLPDPVDRRVDHRPAGGRDRRGDPVRQCPAWPERGLRRRRAGRGAVALARARPGLDGGRPHHRALVGAGADVERPRGIVGPLPAGAAPALGPAGKRAAGGAAAAVR